jgi:tripartite-type tricarboxylate transporter receptor subunit TctC
VGAPKNTRAETVDRLHEAIKAGLADAALKTRFAEFGDAVFACSHAEFITLIAEDTDKWAKVIKSTGVKSE